MHEIYGFLIDDIMKIDIEERAYETGLSNTELAI